MTDEKAKGSRRRTIPLIGAVYSFVSGIFLIMMFAVQGQYWNTWYGSIFPLMEVVGTVGVLLLFGLGFLFLMFSERE
jgi:hypothetical protein